jgi:hypothetical protein
LRAENFAETDSGICPHGEHRVIARNGAARAATGGVRISEQRLGLGSEVAARIEARLAVPVDEWRFRAPLR